MLTTHIATTQFVPLLIFSHICHNTSIQLDANSINASEGFSFNSLSFSIINLASSLVSTSQSIFNLLFINLGASVIQAQIFKINLTISSSHSHISTHKRITKSFMFSIEVMSKVFSLILCNSSFEILVKSLNQSQIKSKIFSVTFIFQTVGI